MRFGILKSVAHNVADSLASGVGLLVGVWVTEIFVEADASPDGAITVDFLAGTATGGEVSSSLAGAVAAYREALPEFCARHGIAIADYRVLEARYARGPFGDQFVVTVEDERGRRASDRYVGSPGKRLRVRPQTYAARVY